MTTQSNLVQQVMEYAEANPIVFGATVVASTAALFIASTMMKPAKPVANIALTSETSKNWAAFPLKEKIVVSHDTRIFRFALRNSEQVFGLPIGQHISLKADIKNKGDVAPSPTQRSYTPISCDDDLGHFDIMVKVYFAGVHPKFPDGGKMSQHLEKMAIGETILVKGPTGRFEYLGNGRCVVKGKERTVKSFAMIAGGTGITPILQIVRAVLKNPEDKTTMHLVYANQTAEDILLRKELDACALDSRVKVWYTIDRDAPANWQYSTGHVDEAMLRAHLPAGSDDTLAIMCGPPPMLNFACKPNLDKCGYTVEQCYAF
jgi:NAD(P)H-flavin reductase